MKEFNSNSSEFKTAVKEIFITKIVSACDLGPKFYEICGYDAIWFNDGVQFVL